MMKQELTSTTQRKARTRSLIQLGGLLEKSGIVSRFGLELGRDLQKDPEMMKKASSLFGALEEFKITSLTHLDSTQLMLWYLKGKKALNQKSHSPQRK